jgi:hypothetical protein
MSAVCHFRVFAGAFAGGGHGAKAIGKTSGHSGNNGAGCDSCGGNSGGGTGD